jgi:DNA gyrase inhibitor GyrI
MTVDFELKKVPSYRIASITVKGSWKPNILRPEFRKLAKWAARQQVRPGLFFFLESGMKRWVAAVEVSGSPKAEGRIRLRTLPATWVASSTFDPDAVSPRVIYHGLTDWCRWRRKDGKIKRVVSTREVYRADPWKDAKAWAHAEVQFVVKK